MKTLAFMFYAAISVNPASAFETVAVLSGAGRVIDGDGILFGDVDLAPRFYPALSSFPALVLP